MNIKQPPDVSQTDGSPDVAPTKSKWDPPYYVKGLALGIPIYLVAVHMWAWVLIVPHLYRRADFRQFYTSAYMVRTGHAPELYDFSAQKSFEDRLVSPEPQEFELPFVSPAYHAVVLIPFAILTYKHAYIAFAVLNILLIGCCLKLLWPWTLNLRAVYHWLPVALFFGFYPVAWAFIMGQDSILLTAALVGSFVLATRRKPVFSGAVAALALFKLQIVLPIALLFLFWRRWKFSAGFWSMASLLGIFSAWVTGLGQTELYVRSLFSMAQLTQGTAPMATHKLLWQTMGNLHGFVFGITGGSLPRSWIETIAIGLSAVILIWTAHLGRTVTQDALLLLLTIPCAILVSHHSYMYDFTPLLLPAVILLDSFLPCESDGAKAGKLIGRAAALMFVAPIVNSFFPYHTYVVALVVATFLLAVGQAGRTVGLSPDRVVVLE